MEAMCIFYGHKICQETITVQRVKLKTRFKMMTYLSCSISYLDDLFPLLYAIDVNNNSCMAYYLMCITTLVWLITWQPYALLMVR